jgi:hypothetical protein
MPDLETTKFRREAEECWQNAEQAKNPIDRDAWLRIADDWMKLALGEDLRIKIAGLKKMAATFHRDGRNRFRRQPRGRRVREAAQSRVPALDRKSPFPER